MTVKGILLAGGQGTRLYPMTTIVSKQLQPLYNKPVIYYPLTTMLMVGIRDILIITTPTDLPRFEALLSDGSQWGISISYAPQAEPRGIAEALIIGEPFIGSDASMLMLGDNFIYGRLDFIRNALANNHDGATIFAYQVSDPSAYGVVEFDDQMRAVSLEEKPVKPRSNWAVPGMYVYGSGVSAKARGLTRSARGELEITDLNKLYLAEGSLKVSDMGRGVAWLDIGSPENMLNASNFIHAIEARQGLGIGCPEEVALRRGYLSLEGFEACLAKIPKSSYRSYLEGVGAALGSRSS